jgi:hypothetical protein
VPTSAEQQVTVEAAQTGGTFTLTFNGQTTAPIAFGAPADGHGSVEGALDSLPSEPEVFVHGFPGGPYTVLFPGSAAESLITGDGSGLTPSGSVASVTVARIQEGGEGSAEGEYYFEYVTQAQYEQSGFSQAARTPEEPVVAGDLQQFVGQDVPGLQAGGAYRYRLAVAGAPGTPVVQGAVQQLTAPAPAAVQAPAACPNAQLRTGASAGLPDCRAFEQVTPVDKEGAQEPFNYGPTATSGAVVGEDGGHVVLEDPLVNYGSGPDAGQSPYFFSREAAPGGWKMTSGSPQPQTGVQRIVPELYSSDATQIAFEADVHTSLGSGESKEVSFETGPAGGPYTVVASVPRKDAESTIETATPTYDGWDAASGDFSKLILQIPDPNLVQPATGTKSNENDVYEYADGRLSQVNVGVGSCGAKIVKGREQYGVRSSSHAVSEDGSRVFFEAVPGNDCSAPSHLYMRVDGAKTVDLGAYQFAGANAQGTELLLESGGGTDYFIYDTETASSKQIFSGGGINPIDTVVSQEFKAIYFQLTSGDLYRYDVEAESLSYLFRYLGEGNSPQRGQSSPDGRFYYFHGSVMGVPGAEQAFLYDGSENVVECVSCASSSDPEPTLGSYFPDGNSTLGTAHLPTGQPSQSSLSEDGDYAFFDTPAALVSADVDGEVPPDALAGAELQSGEFSPSSDVYEWRKDGINGCDQLQGCVALLTNGRGGFLNLLIGASPSGEDVFIYTRSELLAQDNDNSGDIYDARVNGGFAPPPPAPVECEAAECSTPATAPGDPTPTLLPVPPPPATTKPPAAVTKKTIKCAKGKVLTHGKCVKRKAKPKKKAKKAKRATRGRKGTR